MRSQHILCLAKYQNYKLKDAVLAFGGTREKILIAETKSPAEVISLAEMLIIALSDIGTQ